MPKNLCKLKGFCDFITVELPLTWYWGGTWFCWSGANDTIREQEMHTKFWFENFRRKGHKIQTLTHAIR